MKSAKIVINIIIVAFIMLGVYFKVNDKIAYGGFFQRNGNYQKSSVTWYALFIFAFVFIVFRILLNKADK
jgi:hypothetical protein